MTKKAIIKSQRIRDAFYRDRLSVDEKDFYNTLLDGLMRYEHSISYKNLEIKQIEKIYEALKFEEPILFFVERISCQHMPILRCGSVIPQYRFSKEKAYATIDAINLKVEQIRRNVFGLNDYEKEIFIHDYVCRNVKYDYSFKESSFECVGPILFGKGVCEGISKAVKLLLGEMGIDSIIVHGKSKNQQNQNITDDSHAWNIIKLDNTYYHLDVTFDLSVMAFDVLRYDYFNLSNTDISGNHIFDQSIYPYCGTSRDYYIENNMFMLNKVTFKKYLDKKLRAGEKNILFKLPIVKDIDTACTEIFNIAQSCIISRGMSAQSQLAYNENQNVFLLHIE